jgi:hypothetical protein
VGEYGEALEDTAAMLAHSSIAISSQERADILALAEKMSMTSQISSALNSCPQAQDPDSTATESAGADTKPRSSQ